MKRKIIDEIVELRNHSNKRIAYPHYDRLYNISKCFSVIDISHNQELLRYIPIATVACFEGFFKLSIKEIIDSGLFLENLKKLDQNNLKIDLDILTSITSKLISVGELISHTISCNNLEQVVAVYSTLLDCKYINTLERYEGRKSRFDASANRAKEFRETKDEVVSGINEMFRLRHILCHEFATNIILDLEAIKNHFEKFKLFIDISHDYLWEILSLHEPETIGDLAKKAHLDYLDEESKLSKLMSLIELNESKLSIERKDLHKDVTKLWGKYREASSKLAYMDHTGSFAVIRNNSYLKTATKHRTEELENIFFDILTSEEES